MSTEAVAVVIPARNEEQQIGACLESVRRAADAISPTQTLVVVVDDASSDLTSKVACRALAAQPHLVAYHAGPNVGMARSHGVDLALARLWPLTPESVWLAFTDADTIVPPDWLQRQLTWAAAGVDALAGIVRLPEAQRLLNCDYEAVYASGIRQDSHQHIHGANMGMQASAYLKVGGFSDLQLSEDEDLWRRLQCAGLCAVSDPRLVVETSARRTSRVVGGMATFLKQFDAKTG